MPRWSGVPPRRARRRVHVSSQQGNGSGPGRDRCRARCRRRSLRSRPSSLPRPPRSRTPTTPSARATTAWRSITHIDSREQAQNAARVAADTRAKAPWRCRAFDRGSQCADRAGQCAGSPARRARARRVRGAPRSRSSHRALREVQKAGSAMQAEDYAGAQKLLTGDERAAAEGAAAPHRTPPGAIYATPEVGRVIRKRSSALP